MIDVARARELLIVSSGPGALYRAVTWAWPAIALAGLFVARRAAGFAASASAGSDLAGSALATLTLLGLEILVMAALLWGYRTLAYRFDRAAGKLAIVEGGPVRAERRRELPLASVARIVDRRSARARAIELVLADRSTLVVARERPGSGALDRVASALGELLERPVLLAETAVIAERFEVEAFVEQGGMGMVYRALDRTTGGPVALKLALSPSEEGSQKARFAREMELLAALDHPRICRYVSHGTTDDGRAFLAMQWLDGEDLRAAIGRGALGLSESLAVLRGAVEAVAAVHEHGVVHRDLKPSNLFLRGRSADDLVLLDFGIARRFEGGTRLTGSRAIVGTPHYMAPEQASGASELSPSADVFALGCIFYECLTGKHPFDAQQLVGVLARILFDNPEPVEALRPGVPREWIGLLNRMLAKEPARRPADGAALLREVTLLPAAGAEPSGTTPIAPPAEPERDSGDQVLVTVVLATLAEDPSDAGPLDATVVDRFESIRSAVNRFGCPIDRLADGSLLATVLPRSSATDQVRIAARCALYLRELLPEARISVATGRAPLRRTPRFGDAVDRAVVLVERRLDADGVRLDAVTAGLLEGHFVTAEHGGVLLLVGEKQDLDASRPLLGRPTPCVGRDVELAQLEGLMSSAATEAAPRAAVVLGPPGIGKSRLRHELSRRVRARFPDAVELVGYGDPLSAGSPYVLVADALRRHAGIRAGDAANAARAAIVGGLCRHVDATQQKRVSEFLGELCGVPFPAEGSPPLQAARGDHRVMSEQITMAFVDWLGAECRVHPVAFVLDDVQWADALTLKVLETALRDLKQAPLFVLSFGRPEAEETFPKLFAGQRAFSLALGALSEKASELLVRRVLGPSLPDEPVERIVRLAGGNALFLEELIRAADEGNAGDVPATVVAMLQARLSRLSSEARLVLRAASILGERFWEGGVARIGAAWGTARDPGPIFAQLLETELVERERVSHFPGEVEYSFRHALVGDAAYGLLADADRRAGHASAGAWLEEKGETDGVVLARHAEESGDRERAIQFYARAAEQSLDQYDFGAAVARAERGQALGASARTLGVLESIQASAFYSMGQWLKAAEVGVQALERLPRGSAWWSFTVEKLMQVLPNVGEIEKTRELADDLLRIEPEPEARVAYVRALHGQLLGYAVGGDHARGRRSLDFIEKLGVAVSEPDVAGRGHARLWRSVFSYILGDDLPYALALTEQAIRDLDESQVLYRLSLAHIVQSFVWWGFGQLERSERAARKARGIAQQINDDYHAALAAWYLSVALADQPEPAKLDEAERCARLMVLGDNPLWESVSRVVTARVWLLRGDAARSEADARAGRVGLAGMAPYRLMASASLVAALGMQARHAEACAVAVEDLERLAALEGPVCSEVVFRVAAADALFAGGQRERGASALGDALRVIERRAGKIADPDLKRDYLERRHENRRAAELAALYR